MTNILYIFEYANYLKTYIAKRLKFLTINRLMYSKTKKNHYISFCIQILCNIVL